jgi:hypothetical protein
MVIDAGSVELRLRGINGGILQAPSLTYPPDDLYQRAIIGHSFTCINIEKVKIYEVLMNN